MKIRSRLLLFQSAIIALLLAVGLYGLHSYEQATTEATRVYDHSSRIVTTALQAQVHFKKQVQEWKNILLRGGEPALYRRYLKQFQAQERHTREAIGQLIGLLGAEAGGRQVAETFLRSHHRLGNAYRQALTGFDPAHPGSYLAVDRQIRGIDRQPTDLLDRVVALALRQRSERLAAIHARVAAVKRRILLLTALVVPLSLLLLLWSSDRFIARPVRLATRIARRISSGDLSGEIRVSGSGEPAELLQNLQQMQHNLLQANTLLTEERELLAKRVAERTAELHLANARLSRTAQAKDRFLATMSHELRTPLTSILGISEILGDQAYGPLNPQQLQASRTIHESATHLLALINDILDLAKVEAGRMELQLDQVAVGQLCEASLRLIQQPAREKGLHVTLEMADESAVITGDGRRLKQLLVNLLGNAVKFTPEGGAIGLEVRGERDAGRIRLTVRDSGIGIPPERIPHLFKPFVQLDSELSRRYRGTGLGLAIVQRIADLHGGSVSVESVPGQGSRFHVDLPWHGNPGDDWPPEAGSDGRPGGEDTTGAQPPDARLLLVEDNAQNAEMFATYLRHRGYRVTIAGDGAEAVVKAMELLPEMVLMDIQMPGMDGLEATRRIRRIPEMQRRPIIALTALAMPGDRERCLEAGADAYLSKPVGMKELERTIRKWLARC
ncbi:MAG TPA: response regulator [Sedimenticola sp.]|nr:response regulator [Sedimenticola sp.]